MNALKDRSSRLKRKAVNLRRAKKGEQILRFNAAISLKSPTKHRSRAVRSLRAI